MFKNAIFLLPSESIQTIIQYSPQFVVSTMIPPAKRSIEVPVNLDPKGLVEIETPPLLWIHRLRFVGNQTVQSMFELFTIDPQDQSKILAQGLIGPHVSNGQICWGGVKLPGNIKDAHSRFWASSFRYGKKFNDPVKGGYRDMTDNLCGKRFLGSPQHQDAIFISNEPVFLKKIPEDLWRTSPQGDPLIIGFANFVKKAWNINLKNKGQEMTLRLTEKSINTIKTPQMAL